MQQQLPITRQVILIGGGHTHALFLRKWGMNPIPGVEVSLISPLSETTYTGMLPGFLAGHYRIDEIHIDLVKLCRFAGARLLMASVEDIEACHNLIHVKDRKPLHYDIASVDIGVTSKLPYPLDSNKYAKTIKPLTDFIKEWEYFFSQVRQGLTQPNVAVIGGGVGAVEIAMAIAFAFKRVGLTDYTMSIIDRTKILSGIQPKSKNRLIANLNELSISVIERAVVSGINARQVFFANRKPINSTFTVVSAGATPYEWLKLTDLPLKGGFIEVNDTLRVDPFTNLFAVGDCAHLSYNPRPKAGVFAVRQAPILYANIKSDLLGTNAKKYIPQKHHLKLISLGKQSALLDYKFSSSMGPLMWRLKDFIDKSFMKKFSNLQKMRPVEHQLKLAPVIAGEYNQLQPLCGGCGAKVADKTLEKVLFNVGNSKQKDVVAGIGDDGAIIRIGKVNQILTTDHLREFNSDLWRFSKIAATHALSDIWCMRGVPKTALANIIIPEASDAIQRSWLNQIMGGALSVFDTEKIAVVGGHTSVGKEFNVGFSLTGVCDRRPSLISGAKPNDLIVLTKPIGSGTILAGEMACLSKGSWVQNALVWMEKSQKEASEILSKANAMTDVTGFGLAGHLMRVCESSNLGANIHLDSIPFLDGAEELSKVGVRSSIFVGNRDFRKTKISCVPTAKSNLIFDPQTSGGILAAIPETSKNNVLLALKEKGYCASIIGNFFEGNPCVSVL